MRLARRRSARIYHAPAHMEPSCGAAAAAVGAHFCWPAGGLAAAAATAELSPSGRAFLGERIDHVLSQAIPGLLAGTHLAGDSPAVLRPHLVLTHPAGWTVALWEGSSAQLKLRVTETPSGAGAGGVAVGEWLFGGDGEQTPADNMSPLPPADACCAILAVGLQAAAESGPTNGRHQSIPAGAQPLGEPGLAGVAGLRFGLRGQWLVTVGGPLWDCPMSRGTVYPGATVWAPPSRPSGPCLVVANEENQQMAVRGALFIERSGRLSYRHKTFIAPELRHEEEQTGWRVNGPD